MGLERLVGTGQAERKGRKSTVSKAGLGKEVCAGQEVRMSRDL